MQSYDCFYRDRPDGCIDCYRCYHLRFGVYWLATSNKVSANIVCEIAILFVMLIQSLNMGNRISVLVQFLGTK